MGIPRLSPGRPLMHSRVLRRICTGSLVLVVSSVIPTCFGKRASPAEHSDIVDHRTARSAHRRSTRRAGRSCARNGLHGFIQDRREQRGVRQTFPCAEQFSQALVLDGELARLLQRLRVGERRLLESVRFPSAPRRAWRSGSRPHRTPDSESTAPAGPGTAATADSRCARFRAHGSANR